MAIMGLTLIFGAVSGRQLFEPGCGLALELLPAAIGCATLETALLLFYREMYKVRILQRKAEQWRRISENPDVRSKYDKGETASLLIQKALVRPVKTLVCSPVALIISIYVSVVYVIDYVPIWAPLPPICMCRSYVSRVRIAA